MTITELPEHLRYLVFAALAAVAFLATIERMRMRTRRHRVVRYLPIEQRRRNFTLAEKRRMYRRDRGKCHYCRHKVHFRSHHRWRSHCGKCFEADHYVSFINQGPTTLANGVTACHDCNRDKGPMNGDDYLRLIGASR